MLHRFGAKFWNQTANNFPTINNFLIVTINLHGKCLNDQNDLDTTFKHILNISFNYLKNTNYRILFPLSFSKYTSVSKWLWLLKTSFIYIGPNQRVLAIQLLYYYEMDCSANKWIVHLIEFSIQFFFFVLTIDMFWSHIICHIITKILPFIFLIIFHTIVETVITKTLLIKTTQVSQQSKLQLDVCCLVLYFRD